MDEEAAEAPRSVGPYVILGTLGSGAFATVYKAQHTITTTVVALKCIAKRKLRSQVEFELLQREVNLMKGMDHPFIASFFEVLDDEKNFYIAIELVENGNLLNYINDNHGLKEGDARRIFYQLVTVLEYLHFEKRVVHRDLKAENVLLDRHYNIRLVDFGLSKAFTKGDPFLLTTCGSPAYVSPEIIKEQPYTAAADVWSAGILLYAMVVGALPFNADSVPLMLQQICTVNPVIPNGLSADLRNLLRRLLVKDPKGRIRLNEIRTHPWLADFEDADLLSEDFGLIKSFRTMDVQQLDNVVVSEMRALGYDVNGLMQELRNVQINPRTAAYKMLQRQRIIDEINNWQKVRVERCRKLKEEKMTLGEHPAVAKSQDQAGMLDPAKIAAPLVKKPDGSRHPAMGGGKKPRPMSLGLPRIRKRVNDKSKTVGVSVPLSPPLAPLRAEEAKAEE